MPSVALSIVDGRTVRDLFENGLLEMLRDRGFDVVVYTEATSVPEFVSAWARPWVRSETLYPCESTHSRQRRYFARKRLARIAPAAVVRRFARWEMRRSYAPRPEYISAMRRDRPAIAVATHAHVTAEGQFLEAARSLGIPTLGVVRSWDNVHKGIRTRPDHLAVWNEINRRETVELESFRPTDSTIIGGPQFDPYFAPDTLWPREKLAERFDLDPARPIILYATIGYFFQGHDERWGLDALLEDIASGAIPGRPQVICRLSPMSRLEHFLVYQDRADVRLSYADRYLPTLTWMMSREDVVEVANMLAHADVVITPGSTITLEAAIFDRPTIVPVFNHYQPERIRDYYATWSFAKHFARIRAGDLVPIVEDRGGFAPAVRRALEDPGWYREQRARLVADYVPFTDGRSTERLADLIARLATIGA